jgi:hypothetical protein
MSILPKPKIPKWVTWLDQLVDLCINMGVYGIAVGLVIYVTVYFDIALNEEFALTIIVGGIILLLGSIIIGVFSIIMDGIIRYLYGRFIK